MNNRGFNERELRKAIVTKIDKDGFNKREVFDGDVGPLDITLATMTVAEESTSISMSVCAYKDAEGELPERLETYSDTFSSGDVVSMPLYKGLAIVHLDSNAVDSSDLSVSGNAEILSSGSIFALKITGDFTITYSGT